MCIRDRWYTDIEKEKMLYLRDKDFIIKKKSFYSFRSVINLLSSKDRTEPHYCDLSFLCQYDFKNIHLDESFFYRPIKKMFPHKHMSIRFHNCYARIYDRQRMMDIDLDWKYLTKLKNMYKVEKEIFQDRNVHKIFISDEDRDYYRNIFGISSDSETWPYLPDLNCAMKNRNPLNLDHRLIWFGGVESHKKSSIDWFINEVFPIVKEKIVDAEFHLWGKNTQLFNNPTLGVYGHGYFDGNGMPSNNSLYINPDIIGGGIKLKLLSLIEDGVPFISSFFGFEGYSHDLIDNKYIIVEEENKWAERIINIIK